jgi:hypothetical protein
LASALQIAGLAVVTSCASAMRCSSSVADDPVGEDQASVVGAIGWEEHGRCGPNALPVIVVDYISVFMVGDLSLPPGLSLRAPKRDGEKQGDEN